MKRARSPGRARGGTKVVRGGTKVARGSNKGSSGVGANKDVDVDGDVDVDAEYRYLEAASRRHVDAHGRAEPRLLELLHAFERQHAARMSEAHRARFQDLVARVGGTLEVLPITLPLDDVPFWLRDAARWHAFRSSPTLPDVVDVLVVGAGLAGASATYHLCTNSAARVSVAVVDAEFPGAQSSGRNGGNFQSMSESHHGCYDGLVEERRQWLRLRCPGASSQNLLKRAHAEAHCIFEFTRSNTETMRRVMEREGIECDAVAGGWLRMAGSSAEEKSLALDAAEFATPDNPMTEWSAARIRARTGLPTRHSGHLIERSGNYHPFKFLCGLLECAMKRGARVFSRARVRAITQEAHGVVRVDLADGLRRDAPHTLRCRRVIVATNAFTPDIFPQLKPDILCYTSQIANWEHVRNRLQGMTVTEQEGDIYFNFPKSMQYDSAEGVPRGMLHFGLDDGSVSSPHACQRSQAHLDVMVQRVGERFPEARAQPPSRAWAGPMGLTLDRTPMVGFFDPDAKARSLASPRPLDAPLDSRIRRRTRTRPRAPSTGMPIDTGIVLAVAFQGFGGSFCAFAGCAAAHMALTGAHHPAVPPSVFSPHRFDDLDPEAKARLQASVNDLGYSCTLRSEGRTAGAGSAARAKPTPKPKLKTQSKEGRKA